MEIIQIRINVYIRSFKRKEKHSKERKKTYEHVLHLHLRNLRIILNGSSLTTWLHVPSDKNCKILKTRKYNSDWVLAHLSRRLKVELIVYTCSGVCRCQPFSNIYISEASRPIAIKFNLKHHLGGGKAAWGFGADQFRTMVSMATGSSHRVMMGNRGPMVL